MRVSKFVSSSSLTNVLKLLLRSTTMQRSQTINAISPFDFPHLFHRLAKCNLDQGRDLSFVLRTDS